jgi:tRNA pseudouridine38-40 synthase
MQRYFVQLSFKGTRYHGWQVQPNAITVQEVIENAFSLILDEKISVTGAGRTDTGVHASFYVLHFDTVKNEYIDVKPFLYRINSFLPADIAVQRIWKVPNDAHARFDALSRTYRYIILQNKDPFLTDTSYYLRCKPDIDKMNEAAITLFHISDFTSFSKLHTDVKTNICRIYSAIWKSEESKIIFIVKANRFLRNMVRSLVGTMLDVGLDKISKDDFLQIIEKKDRRAAGVSVPASGLILENIEYPEFLI